MNGHPVKRLGLADDAEDRVLSGWNAFSLLLCGRLILTGRSNTMRITSKGQVTIPLPIREKFGMLPDTDVDFVIDGQTVRLVRKADHARPTRGSAAVRNLRGRADIKMTTDQILALTRGTRRT
jgi:antitoxin PrlF